jgi:ribosomal protein L11 methyltransferase
MWHVSVVSSSALEEELVRRVEEIFQIPAVVYHDVRTGRCTVSVYPSSLRALQIRRGTDRRATLRKLLGDIVKSTRVHLSIARLPRKNWAESWKRHFHPLEIGDSLLVKPGWSRRRARRGQRVVILDPGLSFGTGHHPTTAFCLAQLAACRVPGAAQNFLDIGTGSGLLAIAAAKLGYSPVEAFDFDPESIRVSRDNARRNRVAESVNPRQRDLKRLSIQSRKKWDVICANLTADLLLSQAEKICARLKPGGQLILAGILRTEFRQICDKFATFPLTLAKDEVKEEWHSGRFGLSCI